jgi:glucose dehydrogenase
MLHHHRAGLLALSALALPFPATAEAPDYTTWDQYLGGPDSSQYTALDQITPANVARLEVVWEYPTGEGAPPQFNPIVVDGTMYVQTGDGRIAALDPVTGAEKWKSETTGRIGTRGINYWQSADGSDRRLVFLNDGLVRAIDARTGKYIPGFSVDLRDALPAGSIVPERPLMTSNPGRVFEDTFIVSLPGGQGYGSYPSNIHAYDIRSGALKWAFNMIPRVGEPGSETWPEKDREKFGGGHNWSEFTVDAEAGVAYIPTGSPRFDFYGGNRPGDNLYGNSLLALDARTGKRLWHFQTVHHDLWDYDLPSAPKLMTLRKDGQDIPAVVIAAKHGFVFAFDRRTGEPVWPIEERPVPASDVPGEQASPTQPFPTWPEPFARQSFTEADINPHVPAEDQEKIRQILRTARNEGLFTPPSLRGSISMPGHNGGTSWGGTAIDPVRGRLFVVSREIPTLNTLVPDNRPEATATMPNASPEVRAFGSPYNFMLQSNGMASIKPPFSFLTAYDMNTGERLYHIANGESHLTQQQDLSGIGSQAPRGGPVATATGLLFVGTAGDRTFRARDAGSGRVLWEHKLDAATEGVPAIFAVGGRQFVTIPVGGDGLFPHKGQPTPGPSRYVTFALPAR